MSKVATALTGQYIGTAANASRTLLEALLARNSTAFPEWVALRTLATQGPFTQETFEKFLVDGLAVAPAAVPSLIAELEVKDLITQDADAHVVPTRQGQALYDKLLGAIAEITEQVYGDLDPADLDATHRVLEHVAQRAKTLIAA